MSGASLSGWELEREIDQPLQLLRGQPAAEGRHRAVALQETLAHRGAVPLQHHGRGEKVQLWIQLDRLFRTLSTVAVAARAVFPVEPRRAAVPVAACQQGQQDGEEHSPPQRDPVSRWSDRTYLANSWTSASLSCLNAGISPKTPLRMTLAMSCTSPPVFQTSSVRSAYELPM